MRKIDQRSHLLMGGLTFILVIGMTLTEVGVREARAAGTSSGSSCYMVVSVDQAAGFVTAKAGATGTIKRFRVSDPRLLAALRAGMVISVRPPGGTTGYKPEDCGWNGGRNDNTKTTTIKMCQGHDANGQTVTYPCQKQ